MDKIAGLDVHAKECVAVIQNLEGEVLATESLPTTKDALTAFVAKHELKGAKVGLESGALSFFVAKHLAAAGAKPVIIDAAEVRKKARSKRQKSDTRDAFEICDGLRRGYFVSIVVVPSDTHLKIREALSSRRHFIRLRTQETNAIKGLLRKEGLSSVYRAIKTPKSLNTLCDNATFDDELKQALKRHAAVWLSAHAQIVELDAQLEALAKKCEEPLARLQQISGVGKLVSLATVAYIGDPKRFDSAKHVGSYAGLVAETDNSADRERHGHITKRGPRELRALLVQSAHLARNKGHPYHAEYVRLTKKRGRKIAVVAIAHKLIRVMWAMLRDDSDFKMPKSQAWQALTTGIQAEAP